MPYNVDEFATEIKSKYPEYKTWDNNYLAKQVVDKHPEYKSWVNFEQKPVDVLGSVGNALTNIGKGFSPKPEPQVAGAMLNQQEMSAQKVAEKTPPPIRDQWLSEWKPGITDTPDITAQDIPAGADPKVQSMAASRKTIDLLANLDGDATKLGKKAKAIYDSAPMYYQTAAHRIIGYGKGRTASDVPLAGAFFPETVAKIPAVVGTDIAFFGGKTGVPAVAGASLALGSAVEPAIDVLTGKTRVRDFPKQYATTLAENAAGRYLIPPVFEAGAEAAGMGLIKGSKSLESILMSGDRWLADMQGKTTESASAWMGKNLGRMRNHIVNASRRNAGKALVAGLDAVEDFTLKSDDENRQVLGARLKDYLHKVFEARSQSEAAGTNAKEAVVSFRDALSAKDAPFKKLMKDTAKKPVSEVIKPELDALNEMYMSSKIAEEDYRTQGEALVKRGFTETNKRMSDKDVSKVFDAFYAIKPETVQKVAKSEPLTDDEKLQLANAGFDKIKLQRAQQYFSEQQAGKPKQIGTGTEGEAQQPQFYRDSDGHIKVLPSNRVKPITEKQQIAGIKQSTERKIQVAEANIKKEYVAPESPSPTEGKVSQGAEGVRGEWAKDEFWGKLVRDDDKIVNVPISTFGEKIAIIQKSTGEKGVSYWIDKIKSGERPSILVGEGYTGDGKGKVIRIFDGNHRLEAYRRLGISEVPILDITSKRMFTPSPIEGKVSQGAEGVREPWQMTRKETRESGGDVSGHYNAVVKALNEGKDVPTNVLKSYPKLLNKEQVGNVMAGVPETAQQMIKDHVAIIDQEILNAKGTGYKTGRESDPYTYTTHVEPSTRPKDLQTGDKSQRGKGKVTQSEKLDIARRRLESGYEDAFGLHIPPDADYLAAIGKVDEARAIDKQFPILTPEEHADLKSALQEGASAFDSPTEYSNAKEAVNRYESRQLGFSQAEGKTSSPQLPAQTVSARQPDEFPFKSENDVTGAESARTPEPFKLREATDSAVAEEQAKIDAQEAGKKKLEDYNKKVDSKFHEKEPLNPDQVPDLLKKAVAQLKIFDDSLGVTSKYSREFGKSISDSEKATLRQHVEAAIGAETSEQMKSLGQTILETRQNFRKFINAAQSSKGSEFAAQTYRKNMGEARKVRERFVKKMKPYIEMLDDLSKDDKILVSTFWQHGQKYGQKSIDDLGELINEMFHKETGADLKRLGMLDSLKEFYFPSMFKDEAKAAEVMRGLRDKQVNMGFTKPQELDYLKAYTDHGLEPKFENPIEGALARFQNEQQAVVLMKGALEAEGRGYSTFIPDKQEAPGAQQMFSDKEIANYERLRERAIRNGWSRAKGEVFTQREGVQGSWYMHPEYALIHNRLMSRGMWERGGAAGDAYQSWRNANMLINMFQLGVSGFHLMFTSLDAATSALALSVGMARRGHPLAAMKNMYTNPAQFLGLAAGLKFDDKNQPFLPTGYDVGHGIYGLAGATLVSKAISNYMRGMKLQNAWYGENASKGLGAYGKIIPGTDGISFAHVDDEAIQIADYMAKGGGSAKQDKMYATEFTRSWKGAWRNAYKSFKQWQMIGGTVQTGKAIIQTPMVVAEQAMSGIMDNVVPRQKLGVFSDMMKFELEEAQRMVASGKLAPEAMDEYLTGVAQKAWDSVDNRMGQLVYDNLFWNRTFRDLMMASVRSVGWNVGTIRELGGGVSDLARLKPSYRSDYVIALPLVVGTVGAIYQKLRTGKDPESLLDYFCPQTGGIDENGNPQRIIFASYIKDLIKPLILMSQGDISAVADEGGKTIINKASPSFSIIAQMLNNRDFYGDEIRGTGDPIQTQALDFAKYLLANTATPFSVKNMGQMKGDIGTKAQAFMGMVPAPKIATQTRGQIRAEEFLRKSPGLGKAKNKFESGNYRLRKDLIFQLKINPEQGMQAMLEAYKSGKISESQGNTYFKDAQKTPLQAASNHLAAEDISDVILDTNDPKDLFQLAKLDIESKFNRAFETWSEEKKNLYGDKMVKAFKKVQPYIGATR